MAQVPRLRGSACFVALRAEYRCASRTTRASGATKVGGMRRVRSFFPGIRGPGPQSDVGRFLPGVLELDGPRPRDVGLAALAEAQFGIVTSAQLVELGFSTSAISRMVASGRLVPLYRGVYAVGHTRLLARGHWLAAVLACGDDAALSHTKGAALSDLRNCERFLVDVTVPGRSRCGQRGIRLHRVRELHPDDVTEIDGIRVTTIARTLLDLCDVIPETQVRRAFEKAERMDGLDYRALRLVAGAGARTSRPQGLPATDRRGLLDGREGQVRSRGEVSRLCARAGVANTLGQLDSRRP